MAKDSIEVALALRDDLQELISEGRALLKDMAAERRAFKELLDSIPKTVEDTVAEQIREQMDMLGEATRKAMDAATEQVLTQFNKLGAAIMGEDKRSRRAGRPSLLELASLTAKPDGQRTERSLPPYR